LKKRGLGSEMARAFAGIVLFAALLRAQESDPKPEPVRSARLSVVVIDSVTQLPIKGAAVDLNVFKVNNTAALVDPARGFVTDEHGEIEFALAPGEYSISWIEAAGYIYDVVANSQAIALKSGDRRRLNPIPLSPGGAVSGRVVDGEGQPVAGALVEILELDFAPTKRLAQRGTATTDAEGRYRIDGLLAGRVYVRASSLNSPLAIVTTYLPNVEDIGQASIVRVEGGRELDRIDVRVRRTEKLHIRGRVEGGRPAMFVDLMECAPPTLHEGVPKKLSVRLAEDGSFDAAVNPGSYCVEYRDEAGDNIRFLARTTVRATDRDVNDLWLRPAAPRELTGVVKTEAGARQPLPMMVTIRPVGQLLPSTMSMVRPDGTFSIPRVFPIDYKLSLMGLSGYVKSIALGSMEITDGDFDGANASGPVTIEFAAARGRATGTVKLGSSNPSRVSVVLVPTGSRSNRADLLRSTVADAQAKFAFAGVAPGEYKVLAFDESNPVKVAHLELLNRFQGKTIRIADGEEPNIEVGLISKSELEDAQSRF
jgi:protocatechuate 3,4-dioxygenase beta subunit